MHDRTIKGEVFVFGNAGGLYKNAMTWYDHTTLSIWSQPTGEVLAGDLEGTKLQALPFQLTTWENWIKTYPETLVMSNDLERLGTGHQEFSDYFLIGVELGEYAKAYPYQIAASKIIIEDQLGEFPVLIWANDQDYRVFLRQSGDQVLNFRWNDNTLTDQQTGTSWNPQLGLAQKGDLQGEVLQQLPSFTIWRSSWWDFFPQGEIYEPADKN